MAQIRKVVFGPDYKNGMGYAVDQRVARERDIESENHGQATEKIDKIIEVEKGTYEIWLISLNGSNEVKLWRKFENMPVSVEYNINY